MRHIGLAAAILFAAISMPVGGQTLLNGHFSGAYVYVDGNTSVAPSWTHYRVLQSPQFKKSDFEQMPGGPGGEISCQQIWTDWSTFDAGVYQTITGCTIGQTYRLAGWFLSIFRHGDTLNPPYQDGIICQKIGVDLTGGANPDSAGIIWSWNDPLDRRWRQILVDFTTSSSTITVFARSNNQQAQHNCLSFYDAFTLAPANPVRITNLAVRPGLTDATITWTTDVPSDSTVYWWQYQGSAKDPQSRTISTPTTSHSVTITGLAQSTQYYFKVTSHVSGKDDGVSWGPSSINPFKTMSGTQFASLTAARNNADGLKVYVRDLIVSVGASDLTNAFYLQQQNRTTGIRASKVGITANAGAILDVTGTLSTVSGERMLTGVSVFPVTVTSKPPPLAMATSSIGGEDLNGYNPGITGGTGPFSIGLLVTVWGRITYVSDASQKYFYVDDGRGLRDGTLAGRKGLRVSYLNTNSSVTPHLGNYALVTGASSCFQYSGRSIPQVILRSATDLREF